MSDLFLTGIGHLTTNDGPPMTDTVVAVTDGPYAETKEVLGGYYIIDVPYLYTAIDWAQRCPSARSGTVEVRPVWPTNSP